METRLIFAIISIFTAGLYNFSIKVLAEKWYNTSFVIFISYIIGTIITGIMFLLQNQPVESWGTIILFSIANIFFFFISILSRTQALRYVDSVIFFPLYKTLSPILVTVVSITFFHEVLEFKEWLGIVIGICVPLLLISSHENKRQKNLKGGIIFIIITSVLIVIASSFWKELMVQNLNIYPYLFLTSFFWIIFSGLNYLIFHRKEKITKSGNIKNIIQLWVVIGLLSLSSFYAFQRALEGNYAVVFTINSFSILIPIILSIFIYKDHFNFQKGLVIVLSIVSVILFL